MNVSQLTFFSFFHIEFLFTLTVFPVSTCGQAVQAFPHLPIPFMSLLGWGGIETGILDFMSISLRIFCLLNAVSGGPQILVLGIYLLQPWTSNA